MHAVKPGPHEKDLAPRFAAALHYQNSLPNLFSI